MSFDVGLVGGGIPTKDGLGHVCEGMVHRLVELIAASIDFQMVICFCHRDLYILDFPGKSEGVGDVSSKIFDIGDDGEFIVIYSKVVSDCQTEIVALVAQVFP